MWGAVIGDLAGSIYEYGQYRKSSIVTVDELITKDSFFTDDTILTIAIYDAIRASCDYEGALRKYGNEFLKYQPKTSIKDVFPSAFGGNFTNWLAGKNNGESIGNGAMMRISGIGKMFDTEYDVIQNAIRATTPSHNTTSAVNSAKTVALVIFYARMGYSKQQILKKCGIDKLEYKPFEKFNKTCDETLGNCLFATFTSNNFEEALRKVISYGGDTDTNGAIVGGMAEALYGIPEYLVNQARTKIPLVFSFILDDAYIKKIRKAARSY